MKNPDSESDSDFTVENLLTRAWTRTLIKRFLEWEDSFPELCRRKDVSTPAGGANRSLCRI